MQRAPFNSIQCPMTINLSKIASKVDPEPSAQSHRLNSLNHS